MTQQELNGPDVGAACQQVGRKRMAVLISILPMKGHGHHSLSSPSVYGEHGKFIRRLRRYTSDQVVIELRDEVQVALPSWMLDPVVCQQFRDAPQPRLAIAALLELRHLLDSQPLLMSRVVASRERTAQHTGEDHARSQLPARVQLALWRPPRALQH